MAKKRNQNAKCVKTFRNCIDCFSYHNEASGKAPLNNITFFLGAGFSYAWDKKYPLGTKLFEIDFENLRFDERYEFFKAFCEYCGFAKKMQYDEFASLYYRLQMMKRHTFLQGRFWDKYALDRVEKEIRLYVAKSFKETTCFDFANSDQHFTYKRQNAHIYEFFYKVMSQLTGDAGIPEGIRTNFLTTNYDYIIENIIDNFIRDVLPYYYYSYRGFTPNIANGSMQCVCPHDNQNDYPLIKLNGGFEIFKDGNSFSLDYRDESSLMFKKQPPEIILPCQEQVYDTDYFKEIFPKANRILQETDVLFISGYSFPKEDGLIRFLLKQFAESMRDGQNKAVFYVDYDRHGIENNLRERIQEIFPNFKRNRIFCYTKGFASFAKEFNKLKAAYEA